MYDFKVSNMTCVATVEKAVKSVDGSSKIDIDLGTLAVQIESDRPVEQTGPASGTDRFVSRPADAEMVRQPN
jgi:copper chaperone